MNLSVRSVEYALMRKAVPESSIVANRVLPAFSQAANGGVLWGVIATGLSLVGGSRGRRAAVEGVTAAAAASALANGPLKRAFRRHRPGTGIGRFVVRDLGRVPHSPSMPSGHTAVAAAFATATGLAMPATAAPLGAMAAIVGWSRVTAGRHYPSDVLVGALLGAAVGAATHAIAARIRPPRDVKPATEGAS